MDRKIISNATCRVITAGDGMNSYRTLLRSKIQYITAVESECESIADDYVRITPSNIKMAVNYRSYGTPFQMIF